MKWETLERMYQLRPDFNKYECYIWEPNEFDLSFLF